MYKSRGEKGSEYQKNWRKKHPDYDREYSKKWKEKNPEHWNATWSKLQFGGNRSKVLERDGYKCFECGIENKNHIIKYGRSLAIHHIDGHGRGSDNKNNAMNNLITLCHVCHRRRHIGSRKVVRCNDGKMYDSAKLAAKAAKTSMTSVYRSLNNQSRATRGGYRFKYLK